jgi:phage-related minor tail protein
MGGIKTISIIVAANIKGLESGLGKANKSIAGFASNAARLGSMLSFGVTAPLTALGKSAFDTFSQFENSMTKVMTVTGATTDEMKMLTDEAKRLGATTQFTASQVADLQLVLGRKGFDPTAIKNMEGSILDLALATGEDLSLAANTVASSINAFGLETEEAGRVANTLASAAANSSIQLSTFSTAFGHAGASAKAVGVDIEELSAMMGVLMDNGIKASKAGTGLRKAFMRLNEEGIPFGQTLDRLSSGSMSLSEAQKLVGTTAANQLLILANNKDKVSELASEYENNTDRLKEMADAMGKTTFARVKKMESAIEGMKLEIGALISDAITPMITKITDLASKFGNLDQSTKQLIIVLAGVAAIIGPMLLTVALLTSAWAGLGTVIAALTSPIGLAIAAIVALPIALKYVLDNWDAFAERLGDWSWWRNAIIQTLQFLLKYNPFSVILKGAQKLYDFLGLESKVFNPFDDLVEGLEDLKVETKEYETEFGSLTDSIKDGLKGIDIDLGEGIFGKVSPTLGKEGGGEEKKEFVASPFDFQDEYEQYLIDLESAKAATQRWSNSVKALGLQISQSFADSFAEVVVSGDNLLEGLGGIFKDLLKQIAKMIVKALILAAVFAMIPGMGGLGASQVTGFKDILGSLMGGAFADGGRPPVGKMSLVGEKGPELFVPGSSGTIVPNHALGGGGAVIPDVRISGNDLLIVFDRAERRKNRR